MTDQRPGNSLRGLAAALLIAASGTAKAEVTISDKPTQDMSCTGGVCTATANKAVLNVSDLVAMLGSGDVTVATGSVAKDIEIRQALSWTSTSRLTLDAQQSVTIAKPVTVAGTGALTIATNDGGKHGEFIIVPEHGSVQFWDLSSSLVIDGNSYTLVGDIATLASDIASNPSGFYALAKPYDASVDGTYSVSPIPTTFSGGFEGLGNIFANLKVSIIDCSNMEVGFFSRIESSARVADINIVGAALQCIGFAGVDIGPLAGTSYGTIKNSSASGVVLLPNGNSELAGGLVGANEGTIFKSHADTNVTINGIGAVGGLAGLSDGEILESYSGGEQKAFAGSRSPGGIVGYSTGTVQNTYSFAKVNQKGKCCGGGYYGGLVGENANSGRIVASYAAGHTGHTARSGATGGGLVGYDAAPSGSISYTYWDLDTGIDDPSAGAGNIKNDPGITGLTDAQLKSGLPAGFDPKIWGQNAKINHGYPYLLALPPK
jgi:hypothetical protein